MVSQATRGTDAWVERISIKEMPALCSTVRMLEQMAKDDTASLAHLGQSVLHDHGLTTRIATVMAEMLGEGGPVGPDGVNDQGARSPPDPARSAPSRPAPPPGARRKEIA